MFWAILIQRRVASWPMAAVVRDLVQRAYGQLAFAVPLHDTPKQSPTKVSPRDSPTRFFNTTEVPQITTCIVSNLYFRGRKTNTPYFSLTELPSTKTSPLSRCFNFPLSIIYHDFFPPS